MDNKHSKTKTALLGGIVAMSLLSPLAHADVIFTDNFSEDSSLVTSPNPLYTNNVVPNWTATVPGPYGNYRFGLDTISDLGYGSTDGSTSVYAYVSNYAGGLQTSVGANLNTSASYTLSFDLGKGTSSTTNDAVVDLLAGNTVIGTGTYNPSGQSGGFTKYSFTVLSSTLTASDLALSGDALSIQFLNPDATNPGYHLDFTNVQLSDTVVAAPEPGTWAMLLGGLGSLFFLQRLRRGHKV